MKFKILAALALVLGVAGAAAAYPHYGYGPGPGPGGWERPELSAEERARFEELRNIRYELGTELRKENPNKERARTLFAKELDVRRQLREEGFRNCVENHDHARGRCGWIARNDARMSYGNGAWIKFIGEMSKDNPNKVRAWEYFKEAEEFYRTIETERFNAMLDNPNGAPCWYGGHRGHFGPGPRGVWGRPHRFGGPDCGPRPRGGWGHGPRGYWGPHHGFAPDGIGAPRGRDDSAD